MLLTPMRLDSPSLRLLTRLHLTLQTFMVPTPFAPQVAMHMPMGMAPDLGAYRTAPHSLLPVPVPLAEHPDDALRAMALDPAIVGISKKDIPRHLSPLDIATGGRPRPPPQQMGWVDAPVVVVPMACDLALRLSGLVDTHIPMTGVPVPLPLSSPVCGRHSPGTEEMWEERSRSARTSASTQSDAQHSDDTSMATGSGGDDGAEPCYLWRQLGMCNRPQCRFSHGRVVGQEPQMFDLSKPLRVCHYHVPGSLFSACKKGSTCEFLHL